MAQVINGNAAAENGNKGNLQFVKSYTPEEFKNEFNTNIIDVWSETANHKAFFAWSGKPFSYKNKEGKDVTATTGAVSSNGIPRNRPMISEVIGSDDAHFLLMHEDGREAPSAQF